MVYVYSIGLRSMVSYNLWFIITRSLWRFLFSAAIWLMLSVSFLFFLQSVFNSTSTKTFSLKSRVFWIKYHLFNKFNVDSDRLRIFLLLLSAFLSVYVSTLWTLVESRLKCKRLIHATYNRDGLFKFFHINVLKCFLILYWVTMKNFFTMHQLNLATNLGSSKKKLFWLILVILKWFNLNFWVGSINFFTNNVIGFGQLPVPKSLEWKIRVNKAGFFLIILTKDFCLALLGHNFGIPSLLIHFR